MDRRVVITGMGAITPLGLGWEANWEACIAGRSGIRRITRFDAAQFKSQIAGELPEFDRSQYLESQRDQAV